MTHNAADPKQVAKKKQTSEFIRAQQDTDLAELLKLPSFRRYLWRHMNETCGLMRTSFNPNGSVQTHNIGMQAVALALFAEVEHIDPKAIPQMMNEHAETK